MDVNVGTRRLGDHGLTDNELIAKIEGTSLGYEDHGILTIWLHLNYGGSGQGAGGYALDSYDKSLGSRVPSDQCGRWVAGIIAAAGVSKWEDVKGRTVVAIRDQEGWGGSVVGLRSLPTEGEAVFMFASDAEEPSE